VALGFHHPSCVPFARAFGSLGGADNHRVFGITHAAVDLINDAVDIDPGLGPVKELRLVLLLGDESGKLNTRLLVAVSGSVNPMQKLLT
jgi:hypothetical protein